MTIVKKFYDSSYLTYDFGDFDQWCVYYIDARGNQKRPLDAECFSKLRTFSREYGSERLYNSFLAVYNRTAKAVDQSMLDEITKIAQSYGKDALEMDILLSTLYLTMIAEEQKKNTKLGRRIKRLGVHLLLCEGVDVCPAASGMCGKKWTEIDEMCRDRGF